MKQTAKALLLLSPTLASWVAGFAAPLVGVVWVSLHRTNYLRWGWVGLGNFVGLLSDAAFGKALLNSLLYAAILIPGSLVLGLTVTFAALRSRRWMQHYVRFTFMVPVFAAGVIVAQSWKWIFHPTSGLANWLLGLIGAQPVIWFAGRMSGIFAIAVALAFTVAGTHINLFLAAALGVSRELIECARVDGASRLQIELKILLPLMAPAVALVSLLVLLAAFQMWEFIFVLSNGGPAGGTASLMFNSYESSFVYGAHGAGAAKCLILACIVATLGWVKARIEPKGE